jgi:hypothetical protein
VSHEDLRKLAMSWLKRSKWNNTTHNYDGGHCSIVLSEITSAGDEIPDAIGWRMGHSVLVECKTSRSDFLADAKKPHRMIGTGAGEYRFFLVPKGLVSTSELPADWGLLEIEGKTITKSLDCKRRTLDMAGHCSEKLMLLSTIRRIRTREFLMITAEHLEEILDPAEAHNPHERKEGNG